MTMNVAPPDIEAIERATVAAVAPEACEELDGWLLPFDRGIVKRARSAVRSLPVTSSLASCCVSVLPPRRVWPGFWLWSIEARISVRS